MKRIVFFCLIGVTALVPIPATLAQPNPQDFKRFKELRQQLLDPNPLVSEQAARELAEIADLLHNSVTILSIGLESQTPSVRAQAAKTLATIGGRADGAIVPLVRAIPKEKDDETLRQMIVALSAIAPYSFYKAYIDRALPVILPHANHKNPDVRWTIATALANFGARPKEVVPVLRELLNDPTPSPRPGVSSISILAMDSLRRIGTTDKETTETLFAISHSQNHAKKMMAMVTLAKLAPKDKRFFPLMLKSLRNVADLKLRSTAAGCLIELGPDAKEAVPELINALKVDDPNNYRNAMMLRCAALRALAAIGPAAKDAIPEIQKALSDRERRVRREAEKALKCMEKESK